MPNLMINQGTTVTLTSNVPCNWTLASGSQGTLSGTTTNTTTCTYTAPAVGAVEASHTIGGWQALPNDHVYNTPITNLPVHAGNTAMWNVWRTVFNTQTPAYAQTYTPSDSIDLLDSTAGWTPFNALYNSFQNGMYQIMGGDNINNLFPTQPGGATQPNPWLGVPTEDRQAGNYTPQWLSAGGDHHVFNVNKETGYINGMYDIVPPSQWSSRTAAQPIVNCVSCVGQDMMDYDLHYWTGASSTAEPLLEIRVEELYAGAIKHASVVTLPNSLISGSPTNTFGWYIWPAVAGASAYGGTGATPYGTRYRLKSTYVISSFHPYIQILYQSWKDYGIYIADGGTLGQLKSDMDVCTDSTFMNQLYNISSAHTGPMLPDDFEVVDESMLMYQGLPTAGQPNTCLFGKVNPNNPYVHPDGWATAIATDAADVTQTSKVEIAIRGVAVGVPKGCLSVQAGMPPITLESWVSGTTNQAVQWAITPRNTAPFTETTLGCTISGTNTLNVPATIASPQCVLMTCTSAADPNAKAYKLLWVFPGPALHMRCGIGWNNMTLAANPTTYGNYTDSAGNVWFSEFGGYFGWSNPNTNSYPPWYWPPASILPGGSPITSNIGDAQIWWYYRNGNLTGTDLRYNFMVPNGTYTVSCYFAALGAGTVPASKSSASSLGGHIEINGVVVQPDFDYYDFTPNHMQSYPLVMPYTVTVTDQTLQVAMRRSGYSANAQTGSTNQICAISIVPGASGASAPVQASLPQARTAPQIPVSHPKRKPKAKAKHKGKR